MNRKLLSAAVLAVATSLAAPLVLADRGDRGRDNHREMRAHQAQERFSAMITDGTAAGTKTSTVANTITSTAGIMAFTSAVDMSRTARALSGVVLSITRNVVPARPRPLSSGA